MSNFMYFWSAAGSSASCHKIFVRTKVKRMTYTIIEESPYSISDKVLARILMTRLVPAIAEENLLEGHCGFRANRGTSDTVFVLRQLLDKCQEQNKGLYATFVDLTKAFYTVSMTGLWLILKRHGSPKFATDGDPAAREPTRPDLTQL